MQVSLLSFVGKYMGFTASINHKSQKGSAAFHMSIFCTELCLRRQCYTCGIRSRFLSIISSIFQALIANTIGFLPRVLLLRCCS